MWLRDAFLSRVAGVSLLDAEWEPSEEGLTGAQILGAPGELPNNSENYYNDGTWIKLTLDMPNSGIYGVLSSFHMETIPAIEQRGTLAGLRFWNRASCAATSSPADDVGYTIAIHSHALENECPGVYWTVNFDLTPWRLYGIQDWSVDILRKLPTPGGYFTWANITNPNFWIDLIGHITTGSATGERNQRHYAIWVQPLRFFDLHPEQYPQHIQGYSLEGEPIWKTNVSIWAIEIGGDIFIDWKKTTCAGDVQIVTRPAASVLGDMVVVARAGIEAQGDLAPVTRVVLSAQGDVALAARSQVGVSGDITIRVSISQDVVPVAGDLVALGRILLAVAGDIALYVSIRTGCPVAVLEEARILVASLEAEISVATESLTITLVDPSFVVVEVVPTLAALEEPTPISFLADSPIADSEEDILLVTKLEAEISVAVESLTVTLAEPNFGVVDPTSLVVTLIEPDLAVEVCQP
jgi:hypothetical protein